MIGSIRKDCVNHLVVMNEDHLKRMLSEYFKYYHKDRTHLGLDKDSPLGRPVQVKFLNSIEFLICDLFLCEI